MSVSSNFGTTMRSASDLGDSGFPLHTRLARVEAVQAILNLKARYGALADQKYTQDYQRQPDEVLKRKAWEQAMCFAEDATWHAGASFGGDIQGRQALFAWFARAPWQWAAHFYGSPIIEVMDERRARAQWRLWQLALKEGSTQAVMVIGTTEETYSCDEDGNWLHQSMRFTELQTLLLKDGMTTIASALA